MSTEFPGLSPEKVWYYFSEICKVPRPSKKEKLISDYIIKVARRLNLENEIDEVGNILIRKPATEGYSHFPVVILQSHIDMVCEKNSDTDHDFDTDPIIPRIEGDWVKAKETTLGADDGIGVATQLAILEATDIEHGPLEMLFT
jgi:dipeptidase D